MSVPGDCRFDESFLHANSQVPALTNAFGIYLHIPFCVHRCSYCDFYSSTRYGVADFAALTHRLCRELEESARWLEARGGLLPTVQSVFFGGGTPSLLPVPMLSCLLTTISDHFPVAKDAELTTEANPETVTEAYVDALRDQTPINRVSLGAQSFQAEFLSKLERLGSRESITQAVRNLRAGGFDNFNLDLIFAIPGQDEAKMRADIEAAAALGPRHISSYNLTLKPGHPLFRHLPDDDRAADLYEAAIAILDGLGYRQYEISNYAREGSESRHNLLYWTGGDYLGVGPSAASRFFWNGRFHHRKQVSDFKRYLDSGGFPEPDFEATSWGQTVLEASFLELRTRQGVRLDTFRDRYGYDFRRAAKYKLFREQGLLEEREGWLRLTARGKMLADSVTESLVDVEPAAESAAGFPKPIA